MKIKFFLSFLIFSFFVNVLLGQSNENHDIVYMKNGSIFKGKIIHYDQRENLRLELSSGHVVILESRRVRKIIQGDVDPALLIKPERVKKPYNFREQGLYVTTFVGYHGGGSAFEAAETNHGLGVQASLGYQFHRLLGVGAGIGMDYYYSGSGQNFMPVFGEVRGYLLPRNVTPMYSFAAGYGFAFEDEERNITNAQGGLMVHPSVGFRFGGSKTMNFTLEAGVKIQKGTFEYVVWDVIEHRMTYRRFVVKAGIVF
ncbi:MAG: hypothetical protein AAF573_20940 [Bacteroidota bacterium]